MLNIIHTSTFICIAKQVSEWVRERDTNTHAHEHTKAVKRILAPLFYVRFKTFAKEKKWKQFEMIEKRQSERERETEKNSTNYKKPQVINKKE